MHVSRANDQPDGWFLEIYATLLEGKSWYDIYIYMVYAIMAFNDIYAY